MSGIIVSRGTGGGFVPIKFSNQGHNPATTGVYFIGSVITTTLQGFGKAYVTQACRITRVYFAVFIAGTLNNAADTATASIRVNNTSDTTISSAITFQAVGPTEFNNTGLNIALAKDDFFELKIAMPASFSITPTTVFYSASANIEY